ncbi:uncharacterized protein LOC142916606 [Petromyzon marinus]|uniref:uncharacterized protein LOC142916606 n=1 Tax=Petromyzon marinus TaxID=7757 RepID=UPI003F71FEBB
MLHKKVTVDEAGGEEECRVEDDDDGDSEGRGGDDDHDDDGDRGGDDDHDDYDDRDDDGDHDDDDRDDDDHDDDDDRDDDDYRDVDGHHDDRDEGEAEWWELSVGVSMRSGWRRRMERHDVLYHLQAEVSTRGGTTSTERFVGCRYRHTVPPLRGAAEYCIRVRIVADYPRWKTGEWSPMSCVSFPPPHSAMAGPPISVWATGDAVSEGDTATLRCGVSQNPDSDPIQWSNPHGQTLYFQTVKAHTNPRVSLLHWSSTRLDLTISCVSTLDQGVYSCSLFSLGTPMAYALLTVGATTATTITTTTPTTAPTTTTTPPTTTTATTTLPTSCTSPRSCGVTAGDAATLSAPASAVGPSSSCCSVRWTATLTALSLAASLLASY